MKWSFNLNLKDVRLPENTGLGDGNIIAEFEATPEEATAFFASLANEVQQIVDKAMNG